MRRYRFIGGPWHNRHIPCAGLPTIAFETTVHDGPWPAGPIVRRHRYDLRMFTSDRGTVFFQYVHDSLMATGGREEWGPLATFCLEVSER